MHLLLVFENSLIAKDERSSVSKASLDQNLLRKLSEKTGKPEKYLREQVCKRANKRGINSEAALILWAKQLGFSTGMFQRRLPVHIQEQIRGELPFIFATKQRGHKISPRMAKSRIAQQKQPYILAFEYLIHDINLRDRCRDLIKAPKNFDRVFREATTILEDRIKKLSGIQEKIKPVDLVGKVLNPDPSKAVLRISTDKSEQEGFFNICKGLMLSFRDPVHHKLSDKFTREGALKFCGFIDSLLVIISQASNQKRKVEDIIKKGV